MGSPNNNTCGRLGSSVGSLSINREEGGTEELELELSYPHETMLAPSGIDGGADGQQSCGAGTHFGNHDFDLGP